MKTQNKGQHYNASSENKGILCSPDRSHEILLQGKRKPGTPEFKEMLKMIK